MDFGGSSSSTDDDHVFQFGSDPSEQQHQRRHNIRRPPRIMNSSQDSGKSSTISSSTERRSDSASSIVQSAATTSSSSQDSFRSTPSPSRKRRPPIRNYTVSSNQSHSNEQDRNDVASITSSRSFATAPSVGTASSTSPRRLVVRSSRPIVSVRGATSSSHAVQDAGTYQMLHDECSYLCSTILSPRSSPSKALDAATDLTTLLSSRKTRSVLWQGGSGDGKNDDDEYELGSLNGGSGGPKGPPIPKIWRSILEVLVAVSQSTVVVPSQMEQQQQKQREHNSSRSCNVPFRSVNDNNNLDGGVTPVPLSLAAGMSSPSKRRTKSARRKERELAHTTVIAGPLVPNRGPGTSRRGTPPASPFLLTAEMREVLTCLVHHLSWDCTLSEDHSVASMGSLKVPSMARRIRMSLLEHGAVLPAIMRLMMPRNDPKSPSTGTTNNPESKGGSITDTLLPSSSISHGEAGLTKPLRRDCIDPPSIPTSAYSPVRITTKQNQLGASEQSDCSPSQQSTSSRSLTDECTKMASGITPFYGGDPTAIGRRHRKRRRQMELQLNQQSGTMGCIPEHTPANILGDCTKGWKDDEILDSDCKAMPPPCKKTFKQSTTFVSSNRLNGGKPDTADELSFASTPDALHHVFLPASTPSIRHRGQGGPINSSPSHDAGEDLGSAQSVVSGTTILATHVAERIASLRSKVVLESNMHSSGAGSSNDTSKVQDSVFPQRTLLRSHKSFFDGDYPWVSLVCLESLNRLVTGKHDGGVSCLEGDDGAGTGQGCDVENQDPDDDEDSNPFIVTNRLVGKSGVIPLWSLAMVQSLVWASTCLSSASRSDLFSNPSEGEGYRTDSLNDARWKYCLDRISILASLIDGACLFSDKNRSSFCEGDPFLFEKRNQGLIHQILVFVHGCCQHGMNHLDEVKSAIMLLALRTLTSLSHDNSLAAEQMTECYDMDGRGNSEISIRGIDVLMELVFELEELTSLTTPSLEQATDHEVHRYDCTIFCFNTLANVIEGAGVRRILAETMAPLRSESGPSCRVTWLRWLCRWLVKQTESFHDDILAIGKTGQQACHSRVAQQTSPIMESVEKNKTTSKELQKHEEEKLVAAGNGCVLLACLMTEPESEDPESSATIRRLIIDEMPLLPDGSSSGVAMIINTLKAFCNYYHLSLCDMSVAVVAPVKKLIRQLEELEQYEKSAEK